MSELCLLLNLYGGAFVVCVLQAAHAEWRARYTAGVFSSTHREEAGETGTGGGLLLGYEGMRKGI